MQREDKVITVHNKQVESCGEPPNIVSKSGDGKYIGYFENQHGEQVTLVYDFEKKLGILRMGDAVWENEYTVVETKLGLVAMKENGDMTPWPDGMQERLEQEFDIKITGDLLVMSKEERAWLSACWKAIHRK